MAPAGRPINVTRALLRYALQDGGPDWADALPLLAAVMRAMIRRRGRAAFYATIARDLEVAPSPTWRAIVTRALDSTPHTAAALRLVREVLEGGGHPGLAAVVRRETHREVLGALFRALRSEHEARAVWERPRRRKPPPQS